MAEEQVFEQNVQTPPPEENPDLVEIEIAGAKFSGTKDEVIQKLAKSVEHGTTTIRTQKEALEQLNETVQHIQRPKNENGFDKKRYFEMLADDPIQAQNYMDESRYGEPFEAIKGKITRSSAVAEKVELAQELNEFARRVPDASPDDAKSIEDAMKTRALPWTADNLTATYYLLRAEGQIKPKEQKPEDETETSRRAPPSARGRSGVPASGKRPEEMTTEELKAHIEKQQMGRRNG